MLAINVFTMYAYCDPENSQQIKIADFLTFVPTFIETVILAYAFCLMQQCGAMRYQVSKGQMMLQIGANTAYCLSQFMSGFLWIGSTLDLISDLFVVCTSAFSLLVLIFSMTEIAKIQLTYENNFNTNLQDDICEMSNSELGDP